MPGLGVIGGQSRRFLDPAAGALAQMGNLLRQPLVELFLPEILIQRQLPHPFLNRRRYLELA